MTFSIQHYFEFLSLMVATFCIIKVRNSFLVLFIPYLFIVLGVELYSKYMYVTYQTSTVWLYSALTLLSQLFYSFLFYKYAEVTRHKQAIVILTGTTAIGTIVYYILTSFAFNNYAVVVGGIAQVVLACLHFYYYLQNDNYVKENHYSSGLFIAGGILIFYSGISICLSLYNYILLNKLAIFDTPLYNFIPRYLSVILYGCISIALLIWKKPRTISSSPSSYPV
ncbi:MAG: hypothetical protein V4687_15170 [Bacteroidota bacterium]